MRGVYVYSEICFMNHIKFGINVLISLSQSTDRLRPHPIYGANCTINGSYSSANCFSQQDAKLAIAKYRGVQASSMIALDEITKQKQQLMPSVELVSVTGKVYIEN